MPTKEEKIREIEREWLVIQITLADLETAYLKALKDKNQITDCFILGQTLENQLEYFKRIRAKEAFPMKELPFITEKTYHQLHQRRKTVYQKFYDDILAKLKTEEIVNIIQARLDELFLRYSKHIDNLEVLDKDGVIEMLGYRDKIKILSDEFSYWVSPKGKREATKFVRQRQWHKEYLEKLKNLDDQYKEYVIIKKPDFFKPILKEESQRHLILKPNGTERFAFWWWHL